MTRRIVIIGCGAAMAAAMLSGCGTATTIAPNIQRVEIPVPCDPAVPAEPAWSWDALPIDPDVDEATRALLADRLRARTYIEQLQIGLASCRKPP